MSIKGWMMKTHKCKYTTNELENSYKTASAILYKTFNYYF